MLEAWDPAGAPACGTLRARGGKAGKAYGGKTEPLQKLISPAALTDLLRNGWPAAALPDRRPGLSASARRISAVAGRSCGFGMRTFGLLRFAAGRKAGRAAISGASYAIPA